MLQKLDTTRMNTPCDVPLLKYHHVKPGYKQAEALFQFETWLRSHSQERRAQESLMITIVPIKTKTPAVHMGFPKRRPSRTG